MAASKRIAIIGDIHGCSRSLSALLRLMPKVDQIYQVGDLIDRGPDPKGVFQLIKEYSIYPVLGNHEWLCLTGYQEDLPHFQSWMLNGGEKTLSLYQQQTELEEMIEMIRSFPLYYDLEPIPEMGPERILICHAGIKKGLKLSQSIDYLHSGKAAHIMSSLLWNRSPIFLKDYYQVTGHTPISVARLENWGANIDTGCVFKNQLSMLILPERKLIQVPFQD